MKASTATVRRSRVTDFIAVGGGQAIENYDWMLYGLLAAFFAPQFFPGTDVVDSTLRALAVFGVAFAARPLGAVLLGPFADRVGRKPMMLIAVGAMSLFSLIIGCLPTVSSVGWVAGLFLVILRLLQGLSIGVEQPLLSSYSVELAPEGRIGWYSGMMQSATHFGIMLASLVAFVCSLLLGDDGMMSWGWRVPFWIGGFLGLAVFWLRRGLPETLHSEQRDTDRSTRDVWQEVGRHRLALLAIVFIVAGTQVINYGWFSGIPSAARAVFGQSAVVIFGMTTLLSGIVLVLCPVAGHIADHFGIGRTFVWARLASIPLCAVILLYSYPTVGTFALVMLIGAVLLPFALSLFNAIAASLVPMGSRVTAVGLGYSIGVALFGGTASYVVVWLVSKGFLWVFPVYMGLLLLLGVILYLVTIRTTGLYVGSYANASLAGITKSTASASPAKG
jgi:MHS family alpha-ketoglutarate permease-like MFS transporter